MYDLGDRIKDISWKGCNLSRLIASHLWDVVTVLCSQILDTYLATYTYYLKSKRQVDIIYNNRIILWLCGLLWMLDIYWMLIALKDKGSN